LNIQQDVINEIRSHSDIVEVIGSYIPLEKKGKNYFCVCPFHDDTNPSMSVSQEKQIYTCFSCGATGNVIKFVMEYEHITFPEALKILGDRQGITFTYHAKDTKKSMGNEYEIYQLLNKFYINNINTASGKRAKEYLKSRHLEESLLKEFEIGLSLKEHDGATKLLLGKGYSEKLLLDYGISNRNELGIHDVFYQRIMFPIWDISGNVVAYSGRIYDSLDSAKYINTKETTIFKKGMILYNYHRAKEEVRSKRFVLLMEGQMDVIRAYSIGVKNAIATMGTALTKEHIQAIKRLSNQITLCFDGDEAGEKATLSAGNALLPYGFTIRVVRLSDRMDPDEYILKYGKERFELILGQAKSFLDYKMDYYKGQYHLSDSVEASKYLTLLLEDFKYITDPILKETIFHKLAKELDMSVDGIRGMLKEEQPSKKVVNNVGSKEERHRLDKYDLAEQRLLYYMLQDSKVINIVERRGVFFKRKEYRYLANEIIYYYKENSGFVLADFFSSLNEKEDLLKALNEIVILTLPSVYVEKEIYDYIEVLKGYAVTMETKRLKDQMRQEMDPLKKSEIAQQIVALERGI